MAGSGGPWEWIEAAGVRIDLVMRHVDDDDVSVYLASGQPAEQALARIKAISGVARAELTGPTRRVVEVTFRERPRRTHR